MSATKPTGGLSPGVRTPRGHRPAVEPLEPRVLLATITVNSAGEAVAADAELTLPEAILVANGERSLGDLSDAERSQITGALESTQPDTIHFALPGPAPHVIRPTRGLPRVQQPTIIDGAPEHTDPDTPITPTIEFDGSLANELAPYFPLGGLDIRATSVVRALAINGFREPFFQAGLYVFGHVPNGPAGGTRVEGCWIGPNLPGTDESAAPQRYGIALAGSPNNVIGGPTVAARNVISGAADVGIYVGTGVDTSPGTTIVGNLIGTDPTGARALPNGTGIAGRTIDGLTVAGNVVSGNLTAGLLLEGIGVPAVSPVIVGNLVGTDATGLRALPNGAFGVVATSPHITLGGAAPGAGNVIAGNGAGGLLISARVLRIPDPPFSSTTFILKYSVTSDVAILGNRIGVGRDDVTPVPNQGDGIKLTVGTDHITIGGTAPGAGNLIAHNGVNGVATDPAGLIATEPSPPTFAVAILGNSIFANGRLAIDLNSDGTTPNDRGDDDTGPNGLQNFPFLASASSSARGTTIRGRLQSAPNTTFSLQFFSDVAADPSGFGEGRRFLGVMTLTTDASGDAPFLATLRSTVPPGQVVTATATDLGGNTSEFSRAVTATRAGPTDTAGPAVVSATRRGHRARIIVTFDEDLDLTRAANPANYGLEGPGLDGRFGPSHNRAIPLRTVAYDPATRTVILTPDQFILSGRLRLTVRGTGPVGLTDLAGNLLDGNSDGRPGGDFVTTLRAVPAGPTDIAGPTVVSALRRGHHGRMILTFDEALNPARAANPANYRLESTGLDGRLGPNHNRAIRLRTVAYDPATHTVILTPMRSLVPRRLRLTVRGAGPAGLTDLAGNLLDGNGDGRPGGDFVTILRAAGVRNVLARARGQP